MVTRSWVRPLGGSRRARSRCLSVAVSGDEETSQRLLAVETLSRYSGSFGSLTLLLQQRADHA